MKTNLWHHAGKAQKTLSTSTVPEMHSTCGPSDIKLQDSSACSDIDTIAFLLDALNSCAWSEALSSGPSTPSLDDQVLLIQIACQPNALRSHALQS